MKRYLKVLWLFIKTSVIREIEFRSGFVTMFSVVLVSTLITITFFSVLYGSVTSIKGWSYQEALLLLGTFLLIDNVSSALFYRNFSRMTEYINEGGLDLVLTKPIDPQFTVSFRYTGVSDLLNMFTSMIVIGVALSNVHVSLSIGSVIGYLSLIVLGVAIAYSLWFAVSILAFWIINIEDIQQLWEGLFEFTKYPPDIFFGPVRSLFMIAIPLLTIVAFPAEWLLGRIGIRSIVINLAIATVLSIVTRVLWKFGLTRYESASS